MGAVGFAACADASGHVGPSGLAEEASLHMRVASETGRGTLSERVVEQRASAAGDEDSWRRMGCTVLAAEGRGREGRGANDRIEKTTTKKPAVVRVRKWGTGRAQKRVRACVGQRQPGTVARCQRLGTAPGGDCRHCTQRRQSPGPRRLAPGLPQIPHWQQQPCGPGERGRDARHLMHRSRRPLPDLFAVTWRRIVILACVLPPLTRRLLRRPADEPPLPLAAHGARWPCCYCCC